MLKHTLYQPDVNKNIKRRIGRVTVAPSNRLQSLAPCSASAPSCRCPFPVMPEDTDLLRSIINHCCAAPPRPTGPRRSRALIQRLARFPRSFGGPGQLNPAARCVLTFDPRSRWGQNSDSSLFGARRPVGVSEFLRRLQKSVFVSRRKLEPPLAEELRRHQCARLLDFIPHFVYNR